MATSARSFEMRSGQPIPQPPPRLRKSKLRYAAIDDQLRSGHVGGIVACEKQGCLRDFCGFAEAMKRHLILDCRGRFVELLLGKSELAVKRRADRAGTDRIHANTPRSQFRT